MLLLELELVLVLEFVLELMLEWSSVARSSDRPIYIQRVPGIPKLMYTNGNAIGSPRGASLGLGGPWAGQQGSSGGLL